MSSVTRKNLFFFVVLGIAGYLSVASIVAIPSLQDIGQIPEEVSVDKLREELNALHAQATISITDAKSISTGSEGANPLQQMENALSSSEVISATSQTDIEGLQNTVIRYQESRRDMLDQFEKIILDETAAIRAAQQSAITNYEASNIGRAGSFERIQHFLAIIGWYQNRIGYSQDRLSKCSTALHTLDTKLELWSTRTSKRIPSGMYDLFESNDIDNDISDLKRECQTYQIPSDLPPSRPALGSQLGVFSIVASWLLRTESLSLALIVGLVGFGLLGSACSTAIREHRKRKSNEPLVSDLSGVIIRGLLAAVIVFLAVLGGLVIFASEGDPNPYALLLTCLLASIYSEPVWDWAQRTIHERFGNLGDSDQDGDDLQQEEKPPEENEISEQIDTNDSESTLPKTLTENEQPIEGDENQVDSSSDENSLPPSAPSTSEENPPVTHTD